MGRFMVGQHRTILARQLCQTALMLQDEAEPCCPPIQSVPHADRAIESGKRDEGPADICRDKEDRVDGEPGQLSSVKGLDFRELFDRVALEHERFDDEWIEDICDAIHSKGWLVGCQEWDSGAPGAGPARSTFIAFAAFLSLKMM